MNKKIIPISIIVAGLLIVGALLFINQGKIREMTSGKASADAIANEAIKYINENLIAPGVVASLVNVTDTGSVYKIHLKVEQNGSALGEFDSYISKDGEFLFPEGYNIKQAIAQEESETTTEIPKKDNPDIKLFVMSYCPYGLQAQKMFLPVYDLLKDKASMGVYFVDYIMHEKKEIDENLNQYCIQKEQKEKFSNYLNCFVLDGKSEICFSQANIDRAKLSDCIAETDEEYSIYSLYDDKSTWLNGNFPKFDVNSDLNEQYGVQGSPTIVINDQIVNVSPRSPENFKNIVCKAFNSPPEECSQVLSNETPSAGIGGGTSSTGTEGGCG